MKKKLAMNMPKYHANGQGKIEQREKKLKKKDYGGT